MSKLWIRKLNVLGIFLEIMRNLSEISDVKILFSLLLELKEEWKLPLWFHLPGLCKWDHELEKNVACPSCTSLTWLWEPFSFATAAGRIQIYMNFCNAVSAGRKKKERFENKMLSQRWKNPTCPILKTFNCCRFC